MACPIPLRVNLRRISSARPQNFRPVAPIRRSFLTLPGSELITLKETRILPYESSSLYTLIADVDRYSSFIPYCQESRVTRWSEPDTKGKRWPEQADLKVGWGGFEETFTSKLNCVPDTIVEALGGDAVPAVSKQQSLGRLSRIESPAINNNIFKRLSTRWTVKPLSGHATSTAVRTE
ncbi:Coenzyme Q-binding protein coq10, mitochondrial [Pseudogymnoascus australis]